MAPDSQLNWTFARLQVLEHQDRLGAGTVPLITAITISLFVRWLGFFAASKADEIPQYAYMVYGVPIVASAVAIWFIVSNRTMELPVAWADWMTNFATRVGDGWNAIKLRLSGRGTSGQGVS